MPSVVRAKTAISPITEAPIRCRTGTTACRQAGFTLLELLIVLAIMAIVAAVTLTVGGRSLDRGKPEVAAQQIAQGLRRARSLAIAENVDRAFELDVETRQMRVEGEPVSALPPSLDLELTAAASESRDRHAGSIRFYPDGSSTGGEITVADAGQSFIIHVEWLTGNVEVTRAASPDRLRR